MCIPQAVILMGKTHYLWNTGMLNSVDVTLEIQEHYMDVIMTALTEG